ncbi:hypothetical protein RRU94_16880 [Domibacillus sp. DTU_2020_1001157_1_SI_ALB_TIR_016]|uniref:hypothetical protein n=1 Tax=Domibacillus sp. DTU_2020_1001157_1_SI_ALB_TIR_016 TaxID=3077789 RepID=UPI0028ECD0C8|nr:hypothetical protein [Domibacillus sp. DTU_2020_1001157_1_SI_ALB_TIR_016]WNS79230.1 hypothetical protein RRU94_16880 [Domibacillus sp. DTU_2020_1001157_1_SI_ALB_TIR_016]
MFKIKTFLEKHSYERANLSSIGNTREDYIGLEESSKLKDYFIYKDFTPEYIQMLVTIQYKDKIVVGIDGLNGLDLWEQTYLTAIKQYLKARNAETMYGIDPVTLKLQSIDNTFLHFIIKSDWEPKDVYAEGVLPEKEFLEALLMEAEHFWQVLLEYKVFEGENKREDSPIDYPAQMIKEVKKLRKKLN